MYNELVCAGNDTQLCNALDQSNHSLPLKYLKAQISIALPNFEPVELFQSATTQFHPRVLSNKACVDGPTTPSCPMLIDVKSFLVDTVPECQHLLF